MSNDILEITGGESGLTSIILVGVHGNERCGIEALEYMLPKLHIKMGRVFFGFGNPEAIRKNMRFINSNLNRMFKPDKLLSKEERSGYEYERTQFLKEYLNQASALLDIHASLTPGSKPFIISELNADEIIDFLPINLAVSGFDALEPGGTDYYMNTMGKIGICVECGYFADPNSIEIAKESILSFLKARGHIIGKSKKYPKQKMRMTDIYITKTNEFSLSRDFKDFEFIKEGELIGVDGNKEVRATVDGFILFARNRNQIGGEAFLFGN